MKSSYLAVALIAVAMTATGCTNDLAGGNTAAFTISDCNVFGVGAFPAGEVFTGEASDILGVQTMDWTHDAPDLAGTFVALAADPDGGIDDGIVCRQNGVVSATFQGTGLATVGGVGGYTYRISIQDNRPAPTPGTSTSLTARLDRRPTSWVDGEQTFPSPTDVTVPGAITVTTGDPGSQWAHLWFDGLRCKYRGDGINYVFDRCNDDPSVAPGDTLSVGYVRLHIQNGRCASGDDDEDDDDDDGHADEDDEDDDDGHADEDDDDDDDDGHADEDDDDGDDDDGDDDDDDEHGGACSIEAVADLGSTGPVPAPGIPDSYQLVISGPGLFYSFTSDVIDGDIAIDLLP